jgi:magnesium transporter
VASSGAASFPHVQTLTAVGDEIRDLVRRDEFFWLDLERPDADALRRLRGMVGMDARAAADVLRWDQLPQLRPFHDQLYLVFYGAEPGTPPSPVEVHFFVSGSWVITVRGHSSTALDGLRADLSEEPRTAEQLVVARILRALADTLNDILDPLYERLEEIETDVAESEGSRASTRPVRLSIQEQRRFLLRDLRKVRRQRDILDGAVEDIEALPGLERDAGHALRVVEHEMVRISDRIDDALSRLDAALDLLNASVSNRMNAIIERLTVVATIFLPLTVVTSFFGMNFAWMTDHVESFAAFLILGVGLLAASGAAIFLWVRARLERGLSDQ